MAWPAALALMLGLVVLAMLIGLPVAFAFFLTNIIGAVVFLGGENGIMSFLRGSMASIANFNLAPVPLFLVMGDILLRSGMAFRALDAIDPQSEYVTPAMRRADALLAMAHHHSQTALAPSHGGDRPRIVITLAYETLAGVAAQAGVLAGQLTATGEPVPAGVLRQLLCDADLLPAVLGGASEVLDVGRTRRLVTPPIRTALELRDQGCIFPGCDKPPQDCHAHHLTPWWAGGRTSLSNLVLACAHHHGIIEPGHDPTADRWHARVGDDGTAEVIPPLRVDPNQRPRRHARLREALARPQPVVAVGPPGGRPTDPGPVA